MNVSSRLNSYTEKMNVRFLLRYFTAIETLERDVSKYLQNYISKTGTRLDFKSIELRRFAIALGKANKSLNNIIGFTTLDKKFDKYKMVGAVEIKKELDINYQMIRLATKTQYMYGCFSRYAVLTFMLEESLKNLQEMQEDEKRKQEEESDEIFRHAVYESLVDACSNVCSIRR